MKNLNSAQAEISHLLFAIFQKLARNLEFFLHIYSTIMSPTLH